MMAQRVSYTNKDVSGWQLQLLTKIAQIANTACASAAVLTEPEKMTTV